MKGARKLKTKREAIFNDLRERIIRRHIVPGAKLSDSKLAEEYGVSRTVIRHILRDLERRGLIETHRNRGIFAIRMDGNYIMELLEIREALDALMARLSAQRSTPEDWKGLETLFDDECAKLIQNLDFEGYLKRVAIFHNRMVETTRNQQLQQLIDSIYDRIKMVMRRTVILPQRAERSIIENREVLKAILDKDPDRAEAINRERIRKIRENVQQYQDFIL
ncbi:MAG: GntR family transcriptional regulator [Deltaproteobacteria bacterium]|nr:GntR family transcriptional regulator [Deltaproteobacteria bacterium]